MKMPLSRFFLSACIAFAAVPAVSDAQIFIGTKPDIKPGSTPIEFDQSPSRILVGPTIGLNHNYHTGGFRIINDPICPFFQSGSGVGFSAGITAEYDREYWSIIPRITYQSRPGEFRQQLEDVQVFIPDEGISVTQSVTAKSFVEYRILNAEVMFKHDVVVIDNRVFVGLAAGPSVAYVLDGKITQAQDLEEPLNARFLNPLDLPTDNFGRRLIYADNADIPGRNSLRFSLKAGMQVEVGLFDDQIMMTPGIYYDFGLNNVTSNENWDLNSMMVQVDFRHAL